MPLRNADHATDQPPRRVLLVHNSGKPEAQAALSAFSMTVEKRGVALRRVPSASPEEACRVIASQAHDVDAVVVGGGDGTLNGALPSLLKSDVPLGVLPLGTANDFARTLGIPTDPAGAAEVILRGRRRRVDVGFANDLPFFNVASIGLAADIAASLKSGSKRRLGRLSYAFAALGVLTRAKRFRAVIGAEGDLIRVKSYQITVGNGRYYGGGAAVHEDASIDDATLDVYSLSRGSLWKLVVLAPMFRSGRHVTWREVDAHRAREIDIRTLEPMPVNLDGEIATCTPVRFSVSPKAIEVFAPEPPRG